MRHSPPQKQMETSIAAQVCSSHQEGKPAVLRSFWLNHADFIPHDAAMEESSHHSKVCMAKPGTQGCCRVWTGHGPGEMARYRAVCQCLSLFQCNETLKPFLKAQEKR